MRRILYAVSQLVILAVALGAIYYLGNNVINGVRDLSSRATRNRLQVAQLVIFPGTATAIAAINTEISDQKTHAPTATLTPTDELLNSEGTDSPGTGPDATTPGTAPTEVVPPAPTAPATETVVSSSASTDTPTAAPTDTLAPSATSSSTDTPVPSDTPSDTSTPTKAPPTSPPTNTKRPKSTSTPTAVALNEVDFGRKNLQATVPPTNTKRPSPTPVGPASTPTATQVSPPTAAPTIGATLTALPTVAPNVDAPTPEATNKLPSVLTPTECTGKMMATAVPPPAPLLKSNGNDILNIALIGTDLDVTPSDPNFRTDTIVIVSINRTANTVSMLSIPRDLYVCIPSLGMQRINEAFHWGEAVGWKPGGGWGLFQATIRYNLGIPVHYYAQVSLLGFEQIVNTLAGIDVAVDCPVTDLRFQGQYDAQNQPIYSNFTLNPGYYHMDGSLALWYARMRHSSADFDRNRRQQQVLRAILRTARDQGLVNRAADLWGQLTSVVKTNIQLVDVLGLVPIALNLKSSDIASYYMIKGKETVHWATPQQEDVQLPNGDLFFKTIRDFYTPPSANRLAQEAATIEVLNGTGKDNWDRVATDRLIWEGFNAQAKGTTDAAAKTVVYDYTGKAKPGSLNVILKSLNLTSSQVVSQPDPNRTVDFRVVLGSNYKSCAVAGYPPQ